MSCLFSFIIPFYKGNRYINSLLDNINECVKQYFLFNGDNPIEVVFVNDSPDVEIMLPSKKYKFEIKIISNVENRGIHFSRVNGIIHSKGKYITMLDQDDNISKEFLTSQLNKIKDNDLIIANGVKETLKGKETKIYRKFFIRKRLSSLCLTLHCNCLIVSPGQVVIKKDIIPSVWMENIMNVNGADDFYLWILFLKNNAKIAYNKDILYKHVQQGTNYSNDNDKMINSLKELKTVLNKESVLNLKELTLFENLICYLKDSNSDFNFLKFIKYFNFVFLTLFSPITFSSIFQK